MLRALCIFFAFCSPVAAWVLSYDDTVQSMPSIEVSLEPPVSPLPQVSKEIGIHDAARELIEADGVQKLATAFAALRTNANKRIGDIVGRAMRVFDDPLITHNGLNKTTGVSTSMNIALGNDETNMNSKQKPARSLFANLQQDDSTPVTVHAEIAAQPDPQVINFIGGFEHARSAAERLDLDHAIVSLRGMAESILNDFEAELRSQLKGIANPLLVNDLQALRASAFLQSRTTPLKVVVVPPRANYPTTVSLVEGMALRRRSAESLIMEHILQHHLRLIYV